MKKEPAAKHGRIAKLSLEERTSICVIKKGLQQTLGGFRAHECHCRESSRSDEPSLLELMSLEERFLRESILSRRENKKTGKQRQCVERSGQRS